jgi:pimeloyl-ACP methyl ester carboxylesterase
VFDGHRDEGRAVGVQRPRESFLYLLLGPRPDRCATDRDVAVSMETVKAQAIARERWGNPFEGYDDLLKKVTTSVLVANGKDDIRMPTINSYHLFQVLPKAQLILYPDSGHGFLFQYPKSCAENFDDFLNQKDF